MVLDGLDVERVGAGLGNQAIDDQDVRAQLEQANGQVRSDEAQSAGDQRALPA